VLPRLLSATTLLVGLALVPKSAFAGDAAAAEVLFNEARTLVAKGDYEHACPKLEESQRLDAGMGTLFNLGDCYEHVGKTASAWGAFRDVAAQASVAGQQARANDARARASALEPRLVTLSIDASPAASSLQTLVVKRDDVAIGRPQWGSAIPIDPGKHVIVATADGKRTWQGEVTISETVRATNVVIPALEDQAPAPEKTPVERPSAQRASSGSTQRTVGLVVGGLGVVGLGLGTFFGLKSMSRHDDDQPHCDSSSNCDPQGVALRNEARDAGNISTVAFIAGGALLAGGAVLFLTAPRGSSSGATAAVGFGPGAVTLRGAF
jgi:serine/threonine-protein kinase